VLGKSTVVGEEEKDTMIGYIDVVVEPRHKIFNIKLVIMFNESLLASFDECLGC